MLFVGLAGLDQSFGTELLYAIAQLAMGPIESDNLISMYTDAGATVTYWGYELSPRPKDAKMQFAKASVGSFRLRSFLKRICALRGKSPWPVVEMTTTSTPSLHWRPVLHFPMTYLSGSF